MCRSNSSPLDPTEVSIETTLSSASLAPSQSQPSVGEPSTPTSLTSSPNKVPRGRHGRQASFGDDEDESVDAEMEFGEYDFYDSGGVGWQGFGGDGGRGCGCGDGPDRRVLIRWVGGVWVGSSKMDGWMDVEYTL